MDQGPSLIDGYDGAKLKCAYGLLGALTAFCVVMTTSTHAFSQEQLLLPNSANMGLDDTDWHKTIPGHGLNTATPRSGMNGNGEFQLGNSYIGVQTEKSLRPFEPFRQGDCATDDECTEYSGLPRTEPSKKGMKHFRKPFIGLSITTPLR